MRPTTTRNFGRLTALGVAALLAAAAAPSSAALSPASPAAAAKRDATPILMVRATHGRVLAAGEPVMIGEALFRGDVRTFAESGATLVLAGAEIRLGANSALTLDAAPRLRAGLIETSGALTLAARGWRLTASDPATLLTVAAPRDAVLVSVARGAAVLRGPTGQIARLRAGLAARLPAPANAQAGASTTDPAAAPHRKRDILIGAAAAGAVAAAIIIYHETHNTQTSTGCPGCMVSPAQ